ncbi:hypothetical protein P167DRAFT_506514 [Morchella conica CCBAS932]|uniref:Uncharacterized protein n=2 Tax=Morchella sect. Distantes TaxID=1051054 RepID=A0A3N4KPU1_9PEZI|nr:hypothetical protein P167DRAFT_506514 [Morchella conica CCBAS932]
MISISRLAALRVRFARAVNTHYICGTIPLLHLLVLLAEMALIGSIARRYDAYFEARPIVTMMVTNSILNGIADTVAQSVTAIRERAVRQPGGVHSDDHLAIQLHNLDTKSPLPRYGEELIPPSRLLPPPFDFPRLARFAAWGFIVAPFQFKWFQFLSRSFPLTKQASTVPALKRVVMDQLCFAPVGLAAFFTYMTRAEGGGGREIRKKLDHVYIPALKSNYILWPAVQMLNFRVIPLQFQLPFASTWGIAWGTYLSLTNSASVA